MASAGDTIVSAGDLRGQAEQMLLRALARAAQRDDAQGAAHYAAALRSLSAPF